VSTPPRSTPHATGYEDAITRRIAGLEGRVQELETELARAQQQAQGLVEDNARLRTKGAVADATLLAARRTRTLGWVLVVLALLALAAAAALRFGLLPT